MELVGEVTSKLKDSVDYRTDIKFNDNVNKWKKYYGGSSDETEKRLKKQKSAIMPPWAGTSVDRMLATFTVALFLRKPYFGIFPQKDEPEAIAAADLAQDVTEYQLSRSSPFYQMVRHLQAAMSYGIGCLQTGWDFKKNTILIRNSNIKHFHYPPYSEDITDLDWDIFESWRFIDDLILESKAFEDRYGSALYDNLDGLVSASTELEAVVEKHGQGGGRKPIYLIEYWDSERKVVLANKKTVILSVDNPVGFVPAILTADIPKLEGVAGTGEIEAIEDYIHQIATVVNQRNDNINQSLIPAWLQNASYDILNEEELEDLHPGVRIQVQAPLNIDLSAILQPLPMPIVTENSYVEVAGLERNVQDRRGLYDYSRGQHPERRETATGIMRLQEAGALIPKFILMLMLRTSLVRIPEQVLAWDREYMPEQDILSLSKSAEKQAPVFVKAGGSALKHDFIFIEKVSALDTESLREVKRAQLLQALQILAPMRQELPSVDFVQLVRRILKTFDEPGLESIVREIPSGMMSQSGGVSNPMEALARQALSQRGAPSAMSGKNAGGMLGKVMGAVRGGR